MSKAQQLTGPVNILPVGAFGRAVSRYLKSLVPSAVETVTLEPSPLTEMCLQARVNIVAAWRPVPQICEFMDQFSHTWQRPFLPVVLEATALRLGPVVIPGGGSCWTCWVRRCRQHATWPKEQAAVWQHYSSHPHAGPKGYLEPFAMLAAAKSKQTIDALDSSSAVPGSIWEIDVITRQITTSVVVGVHDCPQCGLGRSLPEQSFAEMKRHLAYLWAPRPEDESCPDL